jgi:hypothetical protein
VDERKVADLFRAAAGDAPPASFDEHDVAAASRRATQRRRSMLAGGGGLAVVIVAFVVLLGTGVFGHTLRGGTPTAASAQSGQRGAPFGQHSLAGPQEGTARPEVRGPNSFPTTPPVQGGGGVGGVGPGAGSTLAGCGPTDRELAVALASALPSVGAPTSPPAAIVTCDRPTRSASYLVTDGQHTGYVTALLLPAGDPGHYSAIDGSRAESVHSTSGRWLVTVVSGPAGAGGVPPLTDRLSAIAAGLGRAF